MYCNYGVYFEFLNFLVLYEDLSMFFYGFNIIKVRGGLNFICSFLGFCLSFMFN